MASGRLKASMFDPTSIKQAETNPPARGVANFYASTGPRAFARSQICLLQALVRQRPLDHLWKCRLTRRGDIIRKSDDSLWLVVDSLNYSINAMPLKTVEVETPKGPVTIIKPVSGLVVSKHNQDMADEHTTQE
jgi:hypothetical protein